MNATPGPYRFHAFDVSYFSAKVRPALRYKQLWYEELRADLGEIMRRTGMGFIPIVVTPEDETWQDSSEIYDRLEKRHPSPPLFPPTLAVSPTLRRVLGVMGRDAAPVLLDGIQVFETWADQRPANLEKMPRAVGRCETTLRGTPLQRAVLPYSLWMLQRTRGALESPGTTARARVDALVDGSGWEAVLAYEPRHRLAKPGFKLEFVPNQRGG